MANLDVDNDLSDSAYDSEQASYTTSLASSVVDYKNENGRRYHAYKEGQYVFPNDEKEMDRLDMMHKTCELAMEGKIFRAPLKNPKRILDIGTGTGIWAIEMGDKFPDADILGNDLSPIQPRWVPPNVHFEVDDIEADWTFSSKFDFIHSRCLYASIKDWPSLMRKTFENVVPGGYAEFADADILWRSPDDSQKGTAGEKVNAIFMKACEDWGREHSPGRYLEKWMKETGFEEVNVKKMIIPFGTWPADKKLKEVGAWNRLQIEDGLESFFMGVFTRMLGYSKEEVDVLCAQLRANFADPNFHSYYLLYSVYGRKPLDAATASAAAASDVVAPQKASTEAPPKPTDPAAATATAGGAAAGKAAEPAKPAETAPKA